MPTNSTRGTRMKYACYYCKKLANEKETVKLNGVIQCCEKCYKKQQREEKIQRKQNQLTLIIAGIIIIAVILIVLIVI